MLCYLKPEGAWKALARINPFVAEICSRSTVPLAPVPCLFPCSLPPPPLPTLALALTLSTPNTDPIPSPSDHPPFSTRQNRAPLPSSHRPHPPLLTPSPNRHLPAHPPSIPNPNPFSNDRPLPILHRLLPHLLRPRLLPRPSRVPRPFAHLPGLSGSGSGAVPERLGTRRVEGMGGRCRNRGEGMFGEGKGSEDRCWSVEWERE
jgi:hypothetical protein